MILQDGILWELHLKHFHPTNWDCAVSEFEKYLYLNIFQRAHFSQTRSKLDQPVTCTSGSTPSWQSLVCVPGARRKPHTPPAQPVRGPGSVHGRGPGRISGRAAPNHAGGRTAQTAQQWQLLRGRAAIQVGATDGPSQHGEEGNWGGLERSAWKYEWR